VEGMQYCQITDETLFSRPAVPVRVYHFFWLCKQEGIFHLVIRRIRRIGARLRRRPGPRAETASAALVAGKLDLQPGEWVEVRPLSEIMAMVGQGRQTFLPQMARSCGKRFTVSKRVNHILCENQQHRRAIKDTVLLNDSICDGLGTGCDRSCFFFWREAWLKRVTGPHG
jgi:hypothetical protein